MGIFQEERDLVEELYCELTLEGLQRREVGIQKGGRQQDSTAGSLSCELYLTPLKFTSH